MPSEAAEKRGETELERIDRNLEELLAEARVALPGVQVLFAFLLILPFNARFGDVTEFEKVVFLVTLLLTALSSAFLIAPSMHHRLLFRRGRKELILRWAHRMAIIGLALLALAMAGAVLLVSHFVFGPAVAIPSTAGVGLTLALVWSGISLAGRRGLSPGIHRRDRRRSR